MIAAQYRHLRSQKGTQVPAFTITLTAYLFKRYAMNRTNAEIMIEEECDYIEERINDGCTVEELSQELVDIYMAA